MGFRYNGALYMYAKNIQGDIIGIVNEAGSMVVEYTYDAWGNPLSTTGTAASTIGAANPLRYRGYYYDEETGLYYLQSRYYNPSWGRFINADGYAQTTVDSIGANMFAYCGNNPVMFSDPSGHSVVAFIGAVGGYAWQLLFGAAGVLSLGALGYAAVDYFANSPAYERDDAESAPIVVPKPTQTHHTHHIVPKAKAISQPARDVLNRIGLSVESNYNKVVLPASYHRHVHTNKYCIYVNDKLQAAYNPALSKEKNWDNVIKALDSIKNELLIGKTW